MYFTTPTLTLADLSHGTPPNTSRTRQDCSNMAPKCKIDQKKDVGNRI